MKQYIDHPDMTYTQLGIQFGLWIVTSSGVLYCLVYKIYPVIAGNPIDDRKKSQ